MTTTPNRTTERLAGTEQGALLADAKEAAVDLAEALAQFTNLILNERVRSYNEGVDAERERCAKIANSRQGPANCEHDWLKGYRDAAIDIAFAIRVAG